MYKFFSIFIALVAGLNFTECQNYDDQVIFEFFYGTALFPNIALFHVPSLPEIINYDGFKDYYPTVVFHFDSGETARDQAIVELITSYLYRGKYNVLVVDYQDVNVISDSSATELAASITRGLEGFLRYYDSHDVHFLGNGVGANVLSITAENLANKGYFISRLTGLNPTKISRTALFVDTIHTEESNYSPQSTGQVAFYVNGGFHPQPRCTGLPSCSKDFAKRVWSESVRSFSAAFPCLPCNSWSEFLNNKCNQNTPVGNMGITAQSYLRGKYFVQTNTREPWSRGTALPSE